MPEAPGGYWGLVVAALGSGTIVAIVNQLFSRRRTAAEADKLKAEAEKLRAETEKLRTEVRSVSSAVQDVHDALATTPEAILFDSSVGIDGADVVGRGTQLWGEPRDRPAGTGSVEVSEGVISIRRTNKAGRYQVSLLRYAYHGVERDYIPRNEILTGQRKLRCSFEAKAVGGAHALLVHVKSRAGSRKDDTLAQERLVLGENEWRRAQLYFRVPPGEDIYLRFDDQENTAADSSVQIRNLVVAERT